MTPIDFQNLDEVSLVYLFLGHYHDQDGVYRTVRWCGPKARTGSGMSFPIPEWSGGGRDGSPPAVWEARMARCSLDMTLGNIEQSIQAINDLSFNVDINMGLQTPANLGPGDLRHDIVFGRWRNKACALWVVDLNTMDHQLVAEGAFDRNPTSIAPNNFAVTAAVNPMIPAYQLWPCGQVPLNTAGFTYDQASLTNGFSYFLPTQYMLNPDHRGLFIGPTFGDPVDASDPGLDEYTWREAVPFGRRTSAAGGHHVFAWVSPQTNCFVEEVYFENSNDANSPLESTVVYTLENTDPARGPVGTWVRFTVLPFPGSLFVWWGTDTPSGEPEGATSRVFVRLSGYGSGEIDHYEYEAAPGVERIAVYRRNATAIRGTLFDILQDTVEDPQFLGRPGEIWGSTALSDFSNTAPATSPMIPSYQKYIDMCCAVPAKLVEQAPSFREVFQNLAKSFPFDIVSRRDPVTGKWRWYPIWRSGFNSAPHRVFTVADMSKTDPVAVQQFDNADGKYSNRTSIRTPEYFIAPLVTSALATSDGKDKIDPTNVEAFEFSHLFEQLDRNEGNVVQASMTWKYWLHRGETGNSSASRVMGFERAQPQRTIQATHGFPSFSVALGDYIRYDIPGVNPDVGMVRKIRFDYDLSQAQITSYHIDHPTSGRGSPPGDNKSYHHDPDDDQ